MTTLYRSVFAFSLLGAACLAAGCTSEATLEESSPDVDDGTLTEQDYGSSYNGWSLSAWGTNWRDFGYAEFYGSFTKSSGTDATRGGGVCFVKLIPGSCSTDANCGTPPTGWWNYCVQGQCWQRPGAQASWCGLGPANAPNAYHSKTVPVPQYNSDTWGVLGCLTKTAGPNTACGGTNTSLYMRHVGHADNGS
jgi:hypothetical protein